MLYLQIREYIYESRIYCPPEHAFLLASYAVQERYGDHNVDVHKADQVAQLKLIPKRWVMGSIKKWLLFVWTHVLIAGEEYIILNL